MKLNFTTNPLITSDDMSSSNMGMDYSGTEQACYFLRDKIYSDKIGAVVREYITNALDEHTKYEINKPVKVTLTDKEFIVRDFAKGLSEYDIRNVFGMYFKSTKRDNNIQTGSFGLGSKAAHCYTDAFYVKSYFNGVCTLYTAVLGGGKSGVPVGQIMKISEEPTSESGLEISVEYNVSDRDTFKRKIDYIVSTCGKNIEFICEGKVISPFSPVEVLEKKGYTFKLYDMSLGFSEFNFGFGTNYAYFKMGEICYKKQAIENILGKPIQHVSLPPDHVLVVEIPIGKMSLPISRESFEDTPSNKRVLDDIKNVLEEIFEEEFADKKDLGIEELLASKDVRTISGKFFVTHKSILYPHVYPMLMRLGITDATKTPLEFNNKKVVCLIPDKESADYWIDKFTDHVSDKNHSYYYLNERWVENIPDPSVLDQLNSYFLFKKVKSTFFGWPKGESNKTIQDFSAKIYYSNRWSRYNFKGTALEIHNHMCNRFSLPTANSIEEAKEFLKNRNWTAYSENIFYGFVIEQTSCSYKGVWTSSKTILSHLKELGWFEHDSDEYKQILSDIQKKQKEEEKLEELKSVVVIPFLEQSTKEHIISRLSKKEKYLQKASDIIKKIRNEKSLRGTVFDTLYREGTSYWFNNKLNRKELRKILLLK